MIDKETRSFSADADDAPKSTMPNAYDLPLDYSCYGLRISTLDLSQGRLALTFGPVPVQGVCSPMYSRAFLGEFTRQMHQAEEAKKKQQPVRDEL